MTKCENSKYQCGCGKIYSSYPAFSNHKKSKHGNHAQPGSKIPRPYAPKRGRPSFTLPHRHPAPDSSYAALTALEVGLLRLEEQYRGLLSEADEEASLDLLASFAEGGRAGGKSAQLAGAVRKFTEVLLTHLSEKLAEVVVEYFVAVCEFLLENVPAEGAVDWGELEGGFRVDCALFNRFFQRKGQLELVRELASRVDAPVQLFLGLTVMLSQYLGALDLASSTLVLRA